MEGQRTNQCQMMDINSCLHVLISYLKHAAELQQSRVLGVVEASGINRVLKLSKEQGAAARQDRIKERKGQLADKWIVRRMGPGSSKNPMKFLPAKQSDQTMCWQGIIDMYLRLRSDGFTVNQIHTDQGGEFCSEALEKWCSSRTILHTYTPGDQRQSNGRVEVNGSKLRSEEYSMQLVLHLLFCLLQLATSMTAFA